MESIKATLQSALCLVGSTFSNFCNDAISTGLHSISQKNANEKHHWFFPHLYLVVGFSRKTEGEVKYWTIGELTSKATLVLVRSKVNGSDVLLHHHNGKQHCSVARLLFIIAYRAYNKLLRHVNAPTFGVKMQSSSQCFRRFFFFRFFLAQAHIDRERFVHICMYVPTKLKVACTYSHMDFFHAYTFWGKQLCWCMYV